VPTGYARNGGVRIAYYVDEGDESRPPVMLLNGWAGGARDWGGLVRRFRRTVVRLDFRGIGFSDVPPEEDYSIDAMAEDALRVWDQVAGAYGGSSSSMDVVGYSMGGLVAQALAATRTPRKLVLASTNKGGPDTVDLVSKDFFDCLDDYDPDVDEKASRRAAAAFFVHGLPRPWVSQRVDFLKGVVDRFVDHTWVARPAKGLRGQKRALTSFAAGKSRLDKLTCPTLVLHGDVDPVLHPQCASLLLHALPSASVLLLAGVGHHAYIQEPLEWANAINDFLDDDDDTNNKSPANRRSLLHYDTATTPQDG